MKKLLYLIIISMTLVACQQSKEQKADMLIKQHIKKTLYKPDTYKPIETKVDSAFAPFDDPEFYKDFAKFATLSSEMKIQESKMKDAKSSMAMWDDPYASSFGKNEYEDAKSEYEDASEQYEKLLNRALKLREKILKTLTGKKKFIGYKAIHNYRADNNAGNTLIGEEVLFIDKEFKEISFSLNLSEYEQIQEAIKLCIEQLEEYEN